MGSMTTLERALGRARNADVGDRARSAADRIADRAVNDGLLDVAYATLDTPVGKVLVAATRRGLVRISFGAVYDFESVLADLSARVSPRLLESPGYFDGVRKELEEYFEGRRTSFDVPVALHGTPFQRRVWEALLEIPYGETTSYGELARRLGSPRAMRAVGLANGRNPVAVIVPCHRVIGADGTLTGYGGGLERKRLLLELESRRLAPSMF